MANTKEITKELTNKDSSLEQVWDMGNEITQAASALELLSHSIVEKAQEIKDLDASGYLYGVLAIVDYVTEKLNAAAERC